MIAAVAAFGLALVTVYVPSPWTTFVGPSASSSGPSAGTSSEAAAGVAPGAMCPADAKKANLDFTVKDMRGGDVRLSDYRGKVILLDFWATWCVPCKYEIPSFVELQEQYGPRGLQVFGVSVDDTADKLEPFAAELKMNYPVLQGLNRDDLQSAYGPIWGIPVSVVIARDGRICARHAGLPSTTHGEKLEQAVKRAFEAEIRALL
jgi:peroxiredoxin